MTSRERMSRAMRPRARALPDRVPVMCQLALGHYFLHAGTDPVDIWHDSTAFGDALLLLQRRYGFDGVLVNLPGRDPAWRTAISSIEARGVNRLVRWSNGLTTLVPPDDNPHVFLAEGTRPPRQAFDALSPESLFYVEPHGQFGMEWSGGRTFPPWQFDTIRHVRERAPEISVHGEVFSPFSQLLELLGYSDALVALIEAPDKVRACLDALGAGAVALACGQIDNGADAVLISSAFAGAGFISPRQYRGFVLPCERAVIEGIKASHPAVPVYTHTCGAIGDRLDLMAETGTDGIDTLDPPPLGTVELADAKQHVGGRLFIKGNLDPVATLLNGSAEQCRAAAIGRVQTAMAGGGYILSSACSVAPHTPPDNVQQLLAAAREAGRYGAA
jgi:hypothetical protein